VSLGEAQVHNEIYVCFGIVLIAILLVGSSFCIALFWLVKSSRDRKPARLSPISRGLLLFGVAIVLCFAYAMFIEPFWLDVTHIELHSKKIPAGSRGFRIAHISDLHSDPQARLEEKLQATIAAEKPDFIVFTGDCLNSEGGLANFKNFIAATSSIAPTFVVKGNWDAWYFRKLNAFENSGAVELNGKVHEFIENEIPISIAGFAVKPDREAEPEGGQIALSKTLGEVSSKKTFSIFLYHYPDLIEEVSEHKVDLYLSGHTHGGQVRLPVYGAIVTLSKYGKKFESGLYRVRDTALYVNRGIGMEGGIAPRIRFLCRPELTIIDVLPEHGVSEK
jgi:predicted MPP superfamily phosphohydrolase